MEQTKMANYMMIVASNPQTGNVTFMQTIWCSCKQNHSHLDNSTLHLRSAARNLILGANFTADLMATMLPDPYWSSSMLIVERTSMAHITKSADAVEIPVYQICWCNQKWCQRKSQTEKPCSVERAICSDIDRTTKDKIWHGPPGPECRQGSCALSHHTMQVLKASGTKRLPIRLCRLVRHRQILEQLKCRPLACQNQEGTCKCVASQTRTCRAAGGKP